MVTYFRRLTFIGRQIYKHEAQKKKWSMLLSIISIFVAFIYFKQKNMKYNETLSVIPVPIHVFDKLFAIIIYWVS